MKGLFNRLKLPIEDIEGFKKVNLRLNGFSVG